MTRRVLVLGGTMEASALARALAGRDEVDATLSLAGRTSEPRPQPLRLRVGGFGGVEGLRAYLRDARIARVVDATHPFAAQMARNAALACAAEGVPLAKLTRPPWRPQDGDRWIEVEDGAAAAAALGPTPRRVFLTVGRTSLAPFAAAPWHFYLIRAIETPDDLDRFPHHGLHLARGPFSRADERDLLRAHRIDMLVAKNSGGAATLAKLHVARDLGLPVVMIERPAAPDVAVLHQVADALAFLTAKD